MVKNNIKYCLGLLNKCLLYYCFSRSISNTANTPDHVKCISWNNQQRLNQPTIINVPPDEYMEGLSYYSFAVNLDRCMKSCNTLSNLFNEICVPNKTEDLNLSVFNKITGINELKILTKDSLNYPLHKGEVQLFQN